MPLMTATLGVPRKDQVKGLESEILKALNNANAHLMKGGATELTRWFGDSSEAWRKEARAKIGILKMHLNCTPIKCIVGKSLPSHNNAEALNFSSGLLKGDGMNTLGKVQQSGVDDDLKIGPNFANLPKYATKPFTSGQSQFETLVHELSHLVLGTKDEEISAGTTAYGAAHALQLASANSAKAKTNAENWGFFVEEFRT